MFGFVVKKPPRPATGSTTTQLSVAPSFTSPRPTFPGFYLITLYLRRADQSMSKSLDRSRGAIKVMRPFGFLRTHDLDRRPQKDNPASLIEENLGFSWLEAFCPW